MWRWLCLTIAAFCVLAPLQTFAQATPAPNSAEGLSAEHAAGERSKMYQAGLGYPESLPHLRMTLQRFDEAVAAPDSRHASAVEGREHESGVAAPGLKPENPDGPAR